MDNIKAIRYSNFKKVIHPLLLKVLTAKVTGKLNSEGEFPKDGNYLIVANHFCIEDIPTLGQAVNEHFYLLVSDEDKNTIDGLGLTLNGTEWVHRLDKNSRKISSNNAEAILKQKKNFAMYPEATWNLSPNLLMLPMNYGCIRIALNSNVPIIPVITLFNKESRHTIIGDPFYPTSNLVDSVNKLRDIMASMIYEEMLKENEMEYKKGNTNICHKVIEGKDYYYEERKTLDSNYWNNNVDSRYEAYKRARKDKSGVREFESQFIFTPKTDDYNFFQTFNSVIRKDEDKVYIKRISSEKNGYYEPFTKYSDFDEMFGYGYNEKVLKNNIGK